MEKERQFCFPAAKIHTVLPLSQLKSYHNRTEKETIYRQKNSQRSKFWILWIDLIGASIVLSKSLMTSLYSKVSLLRVMSWQGKMTKRTRLISFILVHLEEHSSSLYLIRLFCVNPLPVYRNGKGKIITDEPVKQMHNYYRNTHLKYHMMSAQKGTRLLSNLGWRQKYCRFCGKMLM